MIRYAVALALAALALSPAAAERRGYTVTGFDRIQVSGPFLVRVTTGGAPSANAEGDARAIDEISVQVTGRTLRVRRNVSGDWGGFPGEGGGRAVLHLTTHALDEATVIGAGDLEIDRMEAGRVVLSLGGNGRLAVGAVEADDLAMTLNGAGIMEVAGRAANGRVTVQGPSTLTAPRLLVDDLRVNVNGAGTVEIAAERSADVTAVGNGVVTVLGDASCTDRSFGSGEVRCGGLSIPR